MNVHLQMCEIEWYRNEERYRNEETGKNRVNAFICNVISGRLNMNIKILNLVVVYAIAKSNSSEINHFKDFNPTK